MSDKSNFKSTNGLGLTFNVPGTAKRITLQAMKPLMAILLFVYFGGAQAQGVTGAQLHAHSYAVWNLKPVEDLERWVIVHNLDEAFDTGIYHVELVGKGIADPSWKIKRVAPHLAVSRDALLRSLVSPRSSGQVYPEQHHDAYRKWRDSPARTVCTTSLEDCIEER